MSRVFPILLVLGLVAGLPAKLFGQEAAEDERRNSLELFLGGVTETEDSETGMGFGLGYIRHLSSRWGLGLIGELSTTGVKREWLIVVPVLVYPVGNLALLAGPAIEGSKEKPADGGEPETSTNVGVRFGAAWEFEIGDRFTLSPEFNVDLIDGEATLVYGLSFGVGF